MLTEMQRLEIENCVLRRVIDQVKRAADKLDKEASENAGNGMAVLSLKERLRNAVDYSDRLEREFVWAAYHVSFRPDMNWAEYLQERFPDGTKQKETPADAKEPGK